MWQGFIPPQKLYAGRSFLGIALDPPNYNPGSWIGAGKALYLEDTGTILLTARPRIAADDARGYAANIYSSKNGVDFALIGSVTKELAAELSGEKIHSIEGTQLLRDPLTGRWHFFISVDTGAEFAWGGVKWETLLLTSFNLEGPWRPEGLVLRNDKQYDEHQARDSTIDIVDGRWLCLYKAKDANRDERPALAVSRDGVLWDKKGPLTVDGEDHVCFINGGMFATSSGTMFIGIESRLDDSRSRRTNVVYADEFGIGHGGGPPARFVAYLLDIRSMNLETVFNTQWQPLSQYEHDEHPLLGYSSTIFDRKNQRFLIYVEALDPELTEAIGINSTVERLLVYESRTQ